VMPANVSDEHQTRGNEVAREDREKTRSVTDRLDSILCPIEEEVPEGAQGQTAFFLFSNVHRDRVKAAIASKCEGDGKVTIGQIGKKIGELWKLCSDEVKSRYAVRAKEVSQHSRAATLPAESMKLSKLLNMHH
jgi:hypothetical protein